MGGLRWPSNQQRLANGTVVEGLGSRNGHRAAANAGVAKRGGKREKRLEPPSGGWTDPAIADIIERKLEHSVNLVLPHLAATAAQ